MTEKSLPPPQTVYASYRILGKRINVRMFTLPLPKVPLKFTFPTIIAMAALAWLAFMGNLLGAVKLFTGPKLYEGQIVLIEPLGNISGVVTGRRDFGAGDAYYVRYTLHGREHHDDFQRWHLDPLPLRTKGTP